MRRQQRNYGCKSSRIRHPYAHASQGTQAYIPSSGEPREQNNHPEGSTRMNCAAIAALGCKSDSLNPAHGFTIQNIAAHLNRSKKCHLCFNNTSLQSGLVCSQEVNFSLNWCAPKSETAATNAAAIYWWRARDGGGLCKQRLSHILFVRCLAQLTPQSALAVWALS